MAHNLEGNMAPNKIVAICIYKNISRKHRLANTKIQIIIMAKIFQKIPILKMTVRVGVTIVRSSLAIADWQTAMRISSQYFWRVDPIRVTQVLNTHMMTIT